jgi:hypothetical protein
VWGYISLITSTGLQWKRVACHPSNRPWRLIGLWDVEDLTFSRQSAHRWWLRSQPYAPAAFYSQRNILSYIFYTIKSQVAATFSALRAGCVLPHRNIFCYIFYTIRSQVAATFSALRAGCVLPPEKYIILHFLYNQVTGGGYVLSPTRRLRFTPQRNIFCYSFLLGAEWTLEPLVVWMYSL